MSYHYIRSEAASWNAGTRWERLAIKLDRCWKSTWLSMRRSSRAQFHRKQRIEVCWEATFVCVASFHLFFQKHQRSRNSAKDRILWTRRIEVFPFHDVQTIVSFLAVLHVFRHKWRLCFVSLPKIEGMTPYQINFFASFVLKIFLVQTKNAWPSPFTIPVTSFKNWAKQIPITLA